MLTITTTKLFYVRLEWSVGYGPADPYGDKGITTPRWAPAFIPARSEVEAREFAERAGFEVGEIKCVGEC